MKLLAYIIPLLLVSFAAQATTQIDVPIYETSEGTITANWNGQALTTTFIGPETWDVSLASAGHSVDRRGPASKSVGLSRTTGFSTS